MTTINNNRLQQLLLGLIDYASAPPTAKYSVADFRIIYNVNADEMEQLKIDHDGREALELIEQKAKLNLKVRLLDPDIKTAEVGAIRAYLEIEEGKQEAVSHTYNIQFAKTAEDMANILDPDKNEKD